jgi:hypothetical protein
MRVVITGHTGGLGLAFFNYFKQRNDDVIGVSRSTGFILPDKFEEVSILAENADLFINNFHHRLLQASFINRLSLKVPIITCGSMAGDYPSKIGIYSRDKEVIHKTHKAHKKKGHLPMLLLKMGFLENWKEYDGIPYDQIINAVDFWLQNPRCSEIEFDNIYYNNNFKKP